MLEDMLGDSFPWSDGMEMVVVGSGGEMAFSESCGGAVIARPAFMVLGRVGVFKTSSSSSPGLSNLRADATSFAASRLSASS